MNHAKTTVYGNLCRLDSSHTHTGSQTQETNTPLSQPPRSSALCHSSPSLYALHSPVFTPMRVSVYIDIWVRVWRCACMDKDIRTSLIFFFYLTRSIKAEGLFF